MRLGMKIKRARFSVSDFLYLYAKISKGERRKSSLLELYAEPYLIFYKDSVKPL